MSEPGKCVALDVGPAHADHGKTWCGREGVYFTLTAPLRETVERMGARPIAGYVHGDGTIDVKHYREWVFTGTDHALLHARQGGGTAICRACATAMREALERGTADEP